MKTVKEIHEFFMNRKDGKELSLGDFMDTVPGYVVGKDETGGENFNWTKGNGGTETEGQVPVSRIMCVINNQ